MATTNFVIFSVLFTAVFAEFRVANIQPCSGTSTEYCTVTEVRMSPCANPARCTFTLGGNASLSFDFTPNFVAPELNTTVYGVVTGKDIEFPGMNSHDGCKLTTCPTVAGASQTLNYDLYVGKKLPKGDHKLKWKVWNKDDESQVCCFMANIRLKKLKNHK